MERTKARLREAAAIAEEFYGQDGKNPVVIAAVLQSLTTDELSETLTQEFEKLAEKVCQAAAVAAGS